MGSSPSLSVTVVWYQPVLEETGESVTLQNKTFLSHVSSVDVLSGSVDHHWRIVIIWILSKSFFLSLWLAVGQKRPTEWYWSTDRGFWTHVFPTEDQKSWSSSGCVSHFLSQLECQEVGGGKVDDTVAAANGGHYSSWAGPNQLEPCGSPSLISNWLRAAKGSRVHRLSRKLSRKHVYTVHLGKLDGWRQTHGSVVFSSQTETNNSTRAINKNLDHFLVILFLSLRTQSKN